MYCGGVTAFGQFPGAGRSYCTFLCPLSCFYLFVLYSADGSDRL